MLIRWDDPAVRLTGRWSRNNPLCAAATANGSYFEFAFRGKTALMHFDTTLNAPPFPHLWLSIDGSDLIEAPLDQHLRVSVRNPDENHVVRVILKGSVEMQPRWFPPLVGRTALTGIDVPERGELPADSRKIIEFVGDSITEGVLIDTDYAPNPAYAWDQHNRVYQDDVCATYGWMTAEALNLRPVMMGYGAVGASKGGCGGVVRAAEAYPYVYAGVPYEGEKPDYIVINHGANDRRSGVEAYLSGYGELLDVISQRNPRAVMVALSAFSDVYTAELRDFCAGWSESHGRRIHFIDASGWIPREPLHPMRDGHALIARELTPRLRALFGQEKA